jgi:hypothetical protein
MVHGYNAAWKIAPFRFGSLYRSHTAKRAWLRGIGPRYGDRATNIGGQS